MIIKLLSIIILSISIFIYSDNIYSNSIDMNNVYNNSIDSNSNSTHSDTTDINTIYTKQQQYTYVDTIYIPCIDPNDVSTPRTLYIRSATEDETKLWKDYLEDRIDSTTLKAKLVVLNDVIARAEPELDILLNLVQHLCRPIMAKFKDHGWPPYKIESNWN